jgi:hypothetical protein
MINANVITQYRNDDGQVSKYQLAEGNGVFYLWDTELREIVQELPGVRYSHLRNYFPHLFLGGEE